MEIGRFMFELLVGLIVTFDLVSQAADDTGSPVSRVSLSCLEGKRGKAEGVACVPTPSLSRKVQSCPKMRKNTSGQLGYNSLSNVLLSQAFDI